MAATAILAPEKQRTRIRRRKTAARVPLALVAPPPPVPVRVLPQLQPFERRGQLLRPTPYADHSEDLIYGLNLTGGCAHACTYCFIRAFPGYPGDDTLLFYSDTAKQLKAELRERRRLPRAVYLCPSSDPFPPFLEVQREAGKVLELLAGYGIESWFMTRGFIRPSVMEALTEHREFAKVTIALSTANNDLRRMLEPLAAPPRLRLKQLAELRRRGIHTEVTIEPLMPGLTDTRENLEPLLDALAAEGVESVTASYMYLRQGIRDNLTRELGPAGWAEPLLQAFNGGPVLAMGSIAPAKHLPRVYREKGYSLLMSLAAARDITVRLNGLTNPDFVPPRPITPAPPSRSLKQMVLQYE